MRRQASHGADEKSLNGQGHVKQSEIIKARVLYDFEAKEGDELNIKKGEVVIIEDNSNKDWWVGSNQRGKGWIPTKFLALERDSWIDGEPSDLKLEDFTEHDMDTRDELIDSKRESSEIDERGEESSGSEVTDVTSSDQGRDDIESGNLLFDNVTFIDGHNLGNKEGGESKDSEDASGKINLAELLPDDLIYIDVTMAGVTVQALLDTGAATNMVRQSVVSKMKVEVKGKGRRIAGLGEREIVTEGLINIPIQFHKVDVEPTPFHVVPDETMKTSVILGKKFFEKSRISIDLRNRMISKRMEDGSKVDIYVQRDGSMRTLIHERVRVFAAQSKTLNELMTPIKVKFEKEKNGLMDCKSVLHYEDGGKREGYRTIDGLLNIEEESPEIWVQHENDTKTSVREGSFMGYVNTVVEIEADEDEELKEWSKERIAEMVKVGDGLDMDQKRKVFTMLGRVKEVLSRDDNDIGKAKVVPQRIVLSKNTPIWQKPRRFAEPLVREIEKQCHELEEQGIIEPSKSPWSSPIVPIRKVDGSLRMCVDYRKVNSVTVAEKFPMPNILDAIYAPSNITYFTILDLTKGYYQVPIHPDSRPITAFSTQNQQYQFRRLSFGLKNSGIQFQRQIQEILSEFSSAEVIIYIDDIMIVSKDFNRHLRMVEEVLTTLISSGIKIKVPKCEFFKSEVSFLGHKISKEGITKSPEYINKVKNFLKPTNVNEMRRFLGLANFQRKFVGNFATIAKPLSECTSGARNKKLEWTKEMEEAFELIKDKLAEEVMLSFPDYENGNTPLELYVDASSVGAGSVLMQEQKGEKRAIAYASSTFNKTERNYSTIERELCALRWGVKVFSQFLRGTRFSIFTDHKPLLYLKNMARDNSRLMRTIMELEEFEYEIIYKPGAENDAADMLSRLVEGTNKEEDGEQDKIPQGLKSMGKVDGGGDSFFESLLVVLEDKDKVSENISISNSLELRETIVQYLLSNMERLGIKRDKNRTKQLKAMRQKGTLPSEEIFLAASQRFNVEIRVHHGMKYPVIYRGRKEDELIEVVHLQCLAGIHFNPLRVRNKTSSEEVQDKYINCVRTKLEKYNAEEVCVNLVEENMCNRHSAAGMCIVRGLIETRPVCALVDTGAQVTLISEDLFEDLKKRNEQLTWKNVGIKLVGLGDQKVEAHTIAMVHMTLGDIISAEIPCAVVPERLMPTCCVLGANFLSMNGIKVDFEKNRLTRMNGGELEECLLASICHTATGCEGISSYPGVSDLSKDKYDNIIRCMKVRGDDEYREQSNGEERDKIRCMLNEEIQEIQDLDGTISDIKARIKKGIPKRLETHWESDQLRPYKTHLKTLQVVHDGLYKMKDGKPIPVIPFKFAIEVAKSTHTGLSHVGALKVKGVVDKHFWHPNMDEIIKDVCSTCVQCQRSKTSNITRKAPVLKIQTSMPGEILSVDLMVLPKTKKGNIGVLVAVDHCSKWLQVVPIKNKSGRTVANAMRRQIIPNLVRVPDAVLSDNGREFTAEDFKEVMREFNIRHIFSTPYHPSSNGAVERVNRTIIQLLKGTADRDGTEWDDKLYKVVVSYNSTTHSQIKLSPSEFILSQEHDVTLPLVVEKSVTETWKSGNPKFAPYKIGQKVLKRVIKPGNLTTNKLKSNYSGPYVVRKVQSNGKTYVIQKEISGAPRIKAHYDQLGLFKETPQYLLESDESVGIESSTGEEEVIHERIRGRASISGYIDPVMDEIEEPVIVEGLITEPTSEPSNKPVVRDKVVEENIDRLFDRIQRPRNEQIGGFPWHMVQSEESTWTKYRGLVDVHDISKGSSVTKGDDEQFAIDELGHVEPVQSPNMDEVIGLIDRFSFQTLRKKTPGILLERMNETWSMGPSLAEGSIDTRNESIVSKGTVNESLEYQGDAEEGLELTGIREGVPDSMIVNRDSREVDQRAHELPELGQDRVEQPGVPSSGGTSALEQPGDETPDSGRCTANVREPLGSEVLSFGRMRSSSESHSGTQSNIQPTDFEELGEIFHGFTPGGNCDRVRELKRLRDVERNREKETDKTGENEEEKFPDTPRRSQTPSGSTRKRTRSMGNIGAARRLVFDSPRVTRSKGKVPDFPNVMRKAL